MFNCPLTIRCFLAILSQTSYAKLHEPFNINTSIYVDAEYGTQENFNRFKNDVFTYVSYPILVKSMIRYIINHYAINWGLMFEAYADMHLLKLYTRMCIFFEEFGGGFVCEKLEIPLDSFIFALIDILEKTEREELVPIETADSISWSLK